jgi:predicted alpha/beta hydrolase family esterase
MSNANQSVLFIQGGGDDAYDWDAKLARSLEKNLGTGFTVTYPRMPDEANPNYLAWKKCVLEELDKLGGGTVLVGHSIGASMLVKMLAEDDVKPSLKGVFLISAPFLHEREGWQFPEAAPRADAANRLPKGVPLFFYHGEADETVPLAHLALYAKAFPQAVTHALPGRNHQLNDDLSEVAHDIRKL